MELNFKKNLLNLKNNFLLLSFMAIAVSLIINDLLISNNIAESTYNDLQTKIIELANITATSPIVINTLTENKNQEEMQEFTEKISAASHIRFITVMDMQKIRKTHPNKKTIGTYYQNHDGDEAFNGKTLTSIDNGSLGRSLRAFAPVYAPDGRQIGVVLVGVMLDKVDAAKAEARRNLIGGSLCGLLAGILGAIFLAKRIKKFTFGMEPFELAKLLEERNAILSSIREGVIAIDKNENITMVNKAAYELFQKTAVCDDLIGKKVEEAVPHSRMQFVLNTGIAEFDQEQNLKGKTILTNRLPITVNGQIAGVVATFRDKSEMRMLAEKLIDIRIYVDALRAQTHEFMNKLHVIMGLIYLKKYAQLNAYITQIADKYQIELGSISKGIRDPVIAGFLLGKLNLAHECDIKIRFDTGCFVPDFHDAEIVHDIITILGNLISNAFDALKDTKIKVIYLKIIQENGSLEIDIKDTGKGIPLEEYDDIYKNSYSTKGPNRGFGLYITKCSVERWGGTIKVSSWNGKGTKFHVSLPYIM